jgi:hypothetical protein
VSLLPAKAGQCLILLSPADPEHKPEMRWAGFSIVDHKTPLWLDNLYIRTLAFEWQGDAVVAHRGAWMTNVTIQGSLQDGKSALWVRGSTGVYAEGEVHKSLLLYLRAHSTHSTSPCRSVWDRPPAHATLPAPAPGMCPPAVGCLACCSVRYWFTLQWSRAANAGGVLHSVGATCQSTAQSARDQGPSGVPVICSGAVQESTCLDHAATCLQTWRSRTGRRPPRA